MKQFIAMLMAVLFMSLGVSFAETQADIDHVYAPINMWNAGAKMIAPTKNANGEYVYDITTDVDVLLASRTVLLKAKDLNDARIKANEAGRGDAGSSPDYVKTRIAKTLSVIAIFLKAKGYVEPTPTAIIK